MDEKQAGKALLEKVYVELASTLLNYANRALKDPVQAEGALQETFRIACTKLDSFSSSPNPKGWIVLVLKNVIRNMERNLIRLRRTFIAMDDCNIDDFEAPTDDRVTNIEYSDVISAEDYKLLRLVVMERFTIKEAADELGISVEACKKRVQRATRRMREGLSLNKKSCPPIRVTGQEESEGMNGV